MSPKTRKILTPMIETTNMVKTMMKMKSPMMILKRRMEMKNIVLPPKMKNPDQMMVTNESSPLVPHPTLTLSVGLGLSTIQIELCSA